MKKLKNQLMNLFLMGLIVVFFTNCKKEDEIPVLTTVSVADITQNSAKCGGNIISDGGSTIIARGVCWNTSTSPKITDSKTTDGTGTGIFTSNISGLSANTTYYVRAYATNGAGTAYGNEIIFVTTESSSIVSNPGSGVTFDGHNYTSIVLGNGQEWMAENLRTSIYANGDIIINVTVGFQWENLTTGAWCHFENDNQYENSYGKYYNWFAVADSRNVCPSGWHVPTEQDWTTLINYLDPNADSGDNYSNTAGGKMKSTGTEFWLSPNTGATNLSGFSGNGGGERGGLGTFGNFGNNGSWWSATEFDTQKAWMRGMYWNTAGIQRLNSRKEYGRSVRCVKD